MHLIIIHLTCNSTQHLQQPTSPHFMDPDEREACFAYRQAEQTASQMLKTGLLTVALSACHSFEPEKTTSMLARSFSRQEQVLTKTTVKVSPKKKKKTIYLTF